ncbi:MAG: hypothetical protein O7F08_01545 [Deltaproteobacteria bacterium]|nr:hypothetical protein [Deltaproteobacteria bacterium]
MDRVRRALWSVGSIALVALLAFAFLPSAGRQTLHLTFSGLPTLENGHYYEGWAVIDGEDWSTGRFNVGPDGELVALDGEPTGGDYDAGIDLSETSLVAITRHPPLDAMGKDSTGPVVPHLISGTVVDLEAPMSVHGGGSLNATFTDATAVVTLRDVGFQLTDIALPELSGGWVYEAWVDVGGAATSLGRFGGANAAGSDALMSKEDLMAKAEMQAKAAMEAKAAMDAKAAMEALAGTDQPNDEPVANEGHHDHSAHDASTESGAYPALRSMVDPRGGRVFITVEANADDSPEPYGVYALAIEIPSDAVTGSEFALAELALGLPTGWATIK